MNLRRAAIAAAWLAGVLAVPAAAQDRGGAVTVRPVPAVPVRGTVAWLEVVPDSPAPGDSLLGIEGEAAGEPLHFVPTDRGYRALMGIPLEGGDSLELSVLVEWRSRTDSTRVSFAVAVPSHRSERLRVDPALARPNPAAQARIEAERARSREVSRRSHETGRLWSGPFRAPRPSRVTSVYGTSREFNGEVRSRHLGTDFAGTTGAPVRAAGRGVVALVADFYLAGRAVYLDHGAGLVTGYFHLSRIDVAEGDTVAAGERIGAVGRTGRVTGPHLHWIARYGAITVDPTSLLRLREGPAAGE